MKFESIDAYLATLNEPQRSTLSALRRTICDIIPDAEETISYNMPGFRLHGKVVAGFAAFKNHVSYFPHSGSVIPALGDAVKDYDGNAGTLRFASDKALPKTLVKKLIDTRIQQVLAEQAKKSKAKTKK